ncbi:mitochondrial thiamine pyrophosphate transporter [Nowakowskiella sp. JEL0407]|nr:mitochondrial thiamine pyrophosphate transporter [Nowakowskiella sp. JEL0407]
MAQEKSEKILTSQQNAIAGAIAGVSSRIVIAPLDVIKIRLQLQSQSEYVGIVNSFRKIIREEGVVALWKGNLPAIFLYFFYGGVQFSVYHDTLRFSNSLVFKDKVNSDLLNFCCGGKSISSSTKAIAGGSATIITYPLDLLRTRFAVQGNTKIYTSLPSAVSQIYKSEGLPGFYRGLYPTLYQIIPSMGIMFGTHEIFHRLLHQTNKYLTTRQNLLSTTPQIPFLSVTSTDRIIELISGACAGMFTKTIVMPFDVIRKRQQVQGPTISRYAVKSIPFTSSFLNSAANIVRTEGWVGLYRGWVPSLVKAAPSSAVTFFVFAECRKVFERMG